MLKETDAHIAKGMTDEQVLQAMIKQYGPLAYVEPPKTGFGLVAWLMPILYLLGGLAVGVGVMKRWRKRPVALASAAGAEWGALFAGRLCVRPGDAATRAGGMR